MSESSETVEINLPSELGFYIDRNGGYRYGYNPKCDECNPFSYNETYKNLPCIIADGFEIPCWVNTIPYKGNKSTQDDQHNMPKKIVRCTGTGNNFFVKHDGCCYKFKHGGLYHGDVTWYVVIIYNKIYHVYGKIENIQHPDEYIYYKLCPFTDLKYSFVCHHILEIIGYSGTLAPSRNHIKKLMLEKHSSRW